MYGASTESPAGEDRLSQPAETHLARDRAIARDHDAPAVLAFQQYRVIFVQMAAPTDIQYHPPPQAPVLVPGVDDHRKIVRNRLGACVTQPRG